MKHTQVVYLGEPNKIGIMLIKSLIGVQSWWGAARSVLYTIDILSLPLYISNFCDVL